MSAAKDVPVPGQMDLDLSDEDGREVVHVPARKKGREEAAGPDSPLKRPAAGAKTEVEGGVTLASITSLLQAQTQEIRTNHRAELNAAIQVSEEKIQVTVRALKSDLQKQIAETNQNVAAVKDAQQSLMDRIEVLEKGGVPGREVTEQGMRKPALVWGGWREDTRRGTILKDLADAIQDLKLQHQVDGEPWVPGARHSIALLEFEKRQGEDDRGIQARMNAIIQVVSAAGIKTEHLQPDRTIWCAVSRPRQDRDGNGSHAGKIRKLLHWNKTDMSLVDCSYKQGSVWLQDTLVGSATKAPPHENVLQGKIKGSWIDAAAVAGVLGHQPAQIAKHWESIMLMWGSN